jgi:ABC-2 type transport system ATP-binding protein
VSFEGTDAAVVAALADVHDATADEGRVRFTVDSDRVAGVMPELSRLGVAGLRVAPPSLEELFLRHYGDDLAALEGNGR